MTPTPSRPPGEKAAGAPGADSTEAADLERWAERVGPGLGHFARQWYDLVPAAWVRLAIQRKVVGQPPKPKPATLNLLSKLLCDWMQTGVCEFVAAPTRPAATAPTPALEYFRGTPGFKKPGWRPPPYRSPRAVAPCSIAGGAR